MFLVLNIIDFQNLFLKIEGQLVNLISYYKTNQEIISIVKISN